LGGRKKEGGGDFYLEFQGVKKGTDFPCGGRGDLFFNERNGGGEGGKGKAFSCSGGEWGGGGVSGISWERRPTRVPFRGQRRQLLPGWNRERKERKQTETGEKSFFTNRKEKKKNITKAAKEKRSHEVKKRGEKKGGGKKGISFKREGEELQRKKGSCTHRKGGGGS